MAVRVIVDSVASIPADLAEEMGIRVASLHVHEGDVDHIETSLDVAEFYGRLFTLPEVPTSSQPSVETFVSLFEEAAEAGDDVVGVFISEKMSGTLQSARLAASMVSGRHPHWKCALVDSTSNSMQEGAVALAAARAALRGGDVGACEAAALAAVPRTRFLFSPDSLEYLRKGGRIGGASALLGTVLQIRPILTVSQGETSSVEKVRTVRRALDRMAALFAEDVKRAGLADVWVHYIGPAGPAEVWAREAVEPVAGRSVRVVPVSPVIGVHVGPAVGIAYETVMPL